MNTRHAYLIMAHHQFDVLERLISQLDDERNDIYLHIDKKVSHFDFKKIRSLALKSSVYFVPRINVNWGGYSQIQCELILLKAAVQRNYRYYHLLSGSDLPLKTQDEIHTFFQYYDGIEFVHFSKETKPEMKKIYSRISRYHLFQDTASRFSFKKLRFYTTALDKSVLLFQRIIRTNRLKQAPFTLKFGSSWFSITDECANFVISKEPWIEQFFSRSKCADELFLQTLLYHSPFKKRLSVKRSDQEQYSNMRKIDWGKKPKRKNPSIWTETDYGNLVSSEALFARKFDSAVDSTIIESLCMYLDSKKFTQQETNKRQERDVLNS